MKTETIEELMMFLCTSKFDIEAQEAKLLEKFFSQDELEAAKEEREEKLNKDEINPISDTEEQEDELENGPENEMEDIGLDTTSLSAAEPDSPGSPSLPPTCTQTRVSGRKRKSREDDIFEYH